LELSQNNRSYNLTRSHTFREYWLSNHNFIQNQSKWENIIFRDNLPLIAFRSKIMRISTRFCIWIGDRWNIWVVSESAAWEINSSTGYSPVSNSDELRPWSEDTVPNIEVDPPMLAWPALKSDTSLFVWISRRPPYSRTSSDG
jgi:hypothetical protein